MELPLLEHAADMPVVVRGPTIAARLRMAPGTREVRAILRLQEGDQGHLAHRRGPFVISNALRLGYRDARLAKPFDDGVVQVAADRQGLFHIGDNATQFEFQRAVSEAQPEAQQECPGRRRLHNLRVRSGDVSQDFADLNRIAFKGDDDLDHDAAQCIRARPVLDDAGDEFGIRNHYACSIKRLDPGCAHANAPHPSLLTLDYDRVADADRPFGQQDEAGYEIRHDGLQPKPDTDRKGAGNQRNLLQVEAEPRERNNDRYDRADIAEDRDDRELEAGLQSGPRQQLRLQPTLHDARDDEQQQKDKSGRQQRFKG